MLPREVVEGFNRWADVALGDMTTVVAFAVSAWLMVGLDVKGLFHRKKLHDSLWTPGGLGLPWLPSQQAAPCPHHTCGSWL